jgi:SAM-dependent methyltransferase
VTESPQVVLQQLVQAHLGGRAAQVLDAGCGFTLPVTLPASVKLVGIDVSAEAMSMHERLDSRIVADIQTYPLPAEAFDLVLCWTVLEHLPEPQAAVANMARAVKRGGLLVLGVPNIHSLRGIVTRVTPHRFHVWTYRRLMGHENAGTPGHAPFPTYLRPEIAPGRLDELAARHGLVKTYGATYPVPSGLPRSLDVLWSVALRLFRAVSLGAWDPAASDYLAVFRKETTSPAVD